MTNFDYLQKEPKFGTFSDVAIAAEKILYIDPSPASSTAVGRWSLQ
jgi:type I restriction enzyme R subunit